MESLAALAFTLLFLILAGTEHWSKQRRVDRLRAKATIIPASRTQPLGTPLSDPASVPLETAIQSCRQWEEDLRHSLAQARQQVACLPAYREVLRSRHLKPLIRSSDFLLADGAEEALSEGARHRSEARLRKLLGKPSGLLSAQRTAEAHSCGDLSMTTHPGRTDGHLRSASFVAGDFRKLEIVFRDEHMAPPIRSAALLTLGEIDPELGWPIFLEALDQPSLLIRQAAVEALARTGRVEAGDMLEKRLAHSEEPLQITILKALGQFSPGRCFAGILPFLFSASPSLATAAGQALRQGDPTPELLAALRAEWDIRSGEDRIPLLELLVALAPASCAGLLSATRRDPCPPLALAAFHCSRTLGLPVDETCEKKVITCLQEELARAGSRLTAGLTKETGDALLQRELATPSGSESQFLALQILMNRSVAGEPLPPPGTVAKALKSGFPSIRGAALLLLGRQRAEDLIRPFLQDVDEYVRGCAVQALGMIPEAGDGDLEERLLTERSEQVQYFLFVTGLRRLTKEKEHRLLHVLPCLSEPMEKMVRQGISWSVMQSEAPMALPGA